MKKMLLMLPFVMNCAFVQAAPRDSVESGSSEAGVQRLLRQLTSERDQLLIDKQALEKDLSEKMKDLEKAESKVSGKESTLDKYKDVNSKLVDRLRLAQDKLVEMNLAYLDQQRQLTIVKEESEDLLVKLSQKQQEMDRHVANNHRMLEINNELLGKYEDKGFIQLILNREPLTQIKKVTLENMFQEYKFELEDLSVGINNR